MEQVNISPSKDKLSPLPNNIIGDTKTTRPISAVKISSGMLD